MPDSTRNALCQASNQIETGAILTADVVVDVDAPDLHSVYTYRIPEPLLPEVSDGRCVLVKFHGRERLGYVMGLRELSGSDPVVPKLQPILTVLEESASINQEQLQTVSWMSERYVCDLISAVRCVAPAILGSKLVSTVRLSDAVIRGDLETRAAPQLHVVETLRGMGGEADLDKLRLAAASPTFRSAYSALIAKGALIETRTIGRPQVVAKTVRVYALSQHADRLLTTSGARRSPQQQRIINLLSEQSRSGGPSLTAREISNAVQVSPSSLKGLVDKGIVYATDRAERRSPHIGIRTGTQAPVLTPGQRKAAEQIRASIAAKRQQTILLFGVTASGKTEVYLDAISHTLALGRTAIVLVPEIALTAQVVEAFVGRFGEQVAVLHSRLSEGERHDEWRRLQNGQAHIVVGARSAVFAPVTNVGLIVVDEEHEASYKQDKSPRYSAREVAGERARISGATLVLGSATPSIETYWNSSPLSAAQPHHFTRLTMPIRIDSRPMPHVEIVDLREEFKLRRALFSERLAIAIGERLSAGHQTILFLNRRGYSQFVLCRDCGWTAKCPNCAVSLAFHSYDRSLKCHHCGYSGHIPKLCPICRGAKVKAFGVGTEKVEEEVLRIYPSARVARMDRDTTTAKGSHGRILQEFRERKADVLIGTQMVAKGLDFPNVTLVGVITADTAINMPDFRAAERTFQLLTQVAGRSGRGDQPGEVIIQTFSPDHYAVRAAIRHDYAAFYEQEIKYRKELNYPPFSRLANIICANESESAAKAQAEAVAHAVSSVKPRGVEVIGPSPAPIARLKNQFRYHVALRAPLTAPVSEIVRSALELLKPAGRRGLSIDIDPLNMA